jgi:tetratricopeptide (TPR) repeat protein
VAALLRAWQDFGAAEGRRWVRESLALCDDATDPELIARLELTETGVNLNLADLIGAQRSAESALARYTELNDELGVAQCRLAMGSILAYASDTRSISLLSEALATFRARGLTKLAGSTHRAMGLAHFFAGDLQAGRRELDEALSIAQSTGDELSLGLIASNLAEVEFSAGNVETALRYSAESMAMHRGRDSMLCTDLGNRAAYFLTLGRYDESRHAAKESLRIANDAQVGATIAFTTQHLAALDALTGDHKRAARLLGYSDRRIATFQSHEREPTEQRTYDMALEALRKEFDDAELTRLMDEGRLWDDERAIAEASQV